MSNDKDLTYKDFEENNQEYERLVVNTTLELLKEHKREHQPLFPCTGQDCQLCRLIDYSRNLVQESLIRLSEEEEVEDRTIKTVIQKFQNPVFESLPEHKKPEYRRLVAYGLLWCVEKHQKDYECVNLECWLCDAHKASKELADKLILKEAEVKS